MKRRMWMKGAMFVLGIVFGFGLLAFLIGREGWHDVLREVVYFGIWPFVGFVAMSLVNFALYSWRWQIITNSHLPPEKRLSLRAMYWHRLSGYAVGYLTPAAQVAGEPARIALLATDGVPIKAATSSVTLDIGFELCVYVVFITAGVIFALADGTGDPITLALTIAALVLLLALVLGFLISAASGKRVLSGTLRAIGFRGKRSKHVVEWVSEMEGLMTEFFKGRSWLVAGVTLLSFVMISFRIVEVVYIAHYFGQSLTFAQAFLMSTLPGIALLLPIPGGLGVFEGGFAAVFTALGVGLNPVAFALIIRLRDLLFIGLGVVHLVERTGRYVVNRTKRA
ncbi:MAG: flippase-like domain-containing protein [Candidatus Uhrbacteria bacterium]|nr:flippase-like domain-containing protein [Candidatus Uhrbacteria bacterium]